MQWCARNIRPAIAHARRVLPERCANAMENQLRNLQHNYEYATAVPKFNDLIDVQRQNAAALADEVLTLR